MYVCYLNETEVLAIGDGLISQTHLNGLRESGGIPGVVKMSGHFLGSEPHFNWAAGNELFFFFFSTASFQLRSYQA